MSFEPDFSQVLSADDAPLWRWPAFSRVALAATLAAIASLPLVSDGALSNACRAPAIDAEAAEDDYPADARSPLQSLGDHDAVFFAEVLVPTRPCSLGYCAGLKVLSALKGNVEKTVLLRVASTKDDRCGPDLFLRKGTHWVVFADTGTSKTGFKYLYAGSEGPSYASQHLPDFSRLEAEYHTLRAQLDGAIAARLGTMPPAR